LEDRNNNNEHSMYIYHNFFFERAKLSGCDAMELKRSPCISIFSVVVEVLKTTMIRNYRVGKDMK
jgi:hypothetical protein